MSRFALAALLFLSFNCFAQITFQKGYVITKDGVKQECFIKNVDWLNNPSTIEYRLADGGEILVGSPETLTEFKVEGFNKYVQAEVDVDISPSTFDKKKEPTWEKRNIFLRVLIDGPATLLDYLSRETDRKFFFTANGLAIRQLVYKEYYYTANHVNKNQTYLGQLRADVWCDSFEPSTLNKLKYAEKELVQYFKKVNECHGTTTKQTAENGDEAKKRRKFNLSITPGVSQTSASFKNYMASNHNTEFPSSTSPRLGVEAEFVFGFARNKWSFFIEPTYESYEGKAGTRSLKYSAVEVHLGVRHYFYLNNDLAIHLNAGVTPVNVATLDSEYRIPHQADSGREGWGFSGGLGADYKRFKGEVRYYTGRDLLLNYLSYSLDVSKVSLIVGYRVIAR